MRGIDHLEDGLPRPPRRPCTADTVFRQPVGQGYLKVPFARCGDGIARHVSEVQDVSQGPFRCLDCEELLSLRQPARKRQHFAHRSDSLCTGETALHRYAKEILAARKTLTLPELVLRAEGVVEPVFTAGIYRFDEVRPELKLEAFQPDALVRMGGNELAVEFLVHHAVDDGKRSKVQLSGISMIEIDLSGVRPGQMSGPELDTMILHTAPRSWIFHRRAMAARSRLERKVAAKKAERGARLRGHIQRARRGKVPSGGGNDALEAVQRAGLEALLGIEVQCAHWFTVPDRLWQAHVLYAHIVKPSETYSAEAAGLRIRGEYPNDRDLASKLPRWLIRTDLSNYPAKLLEEAGFTRATYGSPHAAVSYYLAALVRMEQAVFWSSDEAAFFIRPELHGRLHRRVQLHLIVTRLLGAAAIGDPEATYASWARSFRIGDASPTELVEVGGEAYRDLISRLSMLRSMLSGYRPKVVDDLCGLPLGEVRQRNLDAIAADEAKKAAAEAKAAADRIAWIHAEAHRTLNGEAAAWLAQQADGTQLTFLDFAGSSAAALAHLEQQLRRDGHARQRRIEAERQVADLRRQLASAAKSAYSSDQLAELFLNAGHPKLNGARPIDHCRTPQDLSQIISLMPKRR